jgi:hypothetical protein
MARWLLRRFKLAQPCGRGREVFDGLAQQNLNTCLCHYYQPLQHEKRKKMMMMMNTIVLSLGVWASAVTAIEDNALEFGRFRLLDEKSWSGWMPNAKVARRDAVLLKTARRDAIRLKRSRRSADE